MKKLFIGFIAGVVLSMAVFAEGLAVLPNPFPILFNGTAADVEAYNINGRTYLALGDIAKCFNATAELNETTKQIEVTGSNIVINKNTVIPGKMTTLDGIEILKISGVDCVDPMEVRDRYRIGGKKFFDIDIKPQSSGIMSFYLLDPAVSDAETDKRTTLIENVPFIEAKPEISTYSCNYYIPLDFYLSTIFPIIDKGALD